MNFHSFNWEGTLNLRCSTLYFVVTAEVGEDYLNISNLRAVSDRRDDLVPVSTRLMAQFELEHWDFIWGIGMDHMIGMAEHYREIEREARVGVKVSRRPFGRLD